VHPGVGVRNLEGRRFEWTDGDLTAEGDRVNLLPDQDN
jgi:hypothetical protein